MPRRDETQLVFSSKLEIQPHGAVHEFFDFFGTRTAMFEVLEPHTELNISSTSVVEVRLTPEPKAQLGWDALSAAVPRSLELVDAATQTRRTLPPQDLVKSAKKFADSLDPHAAAMEICKKIFKSMTYKHGVTGVHSVASDAWKQKVGVCQDFAHLMIACLRSLGLAARYVSGYLLTHPPEGQPRLVGADLDGLHAHVAAGALVEQRSGAGLTICTAVR